MYPVAFDRRRMLGKRTLVGGGHSHPRVDHEEAGDQPPAHQRRFRQDGRIRPLEAVVGDLLVGPPCRSTVNLRSPSRSLALAQVTGSPPGWSSTSASRLPTSLFEQCGT